jgi:hypothetical protein
MARAESGVESNTEPSGKPQLVISVIGLNGAGDKSRPVVEGPTAGRGVYAIRALPCALG